MKCLSSFKCGRECIPKNLLCDGEYDYLNGEDESFDHCGINYSYYTTKKCNITPIKPYGAKLLIIFE